MFSSFSYKHQHSSKTSTLNGGSDNTHTPHSPSPSQKMTSLKRQFSSDSSEDEANSIKSKKIKMNGNSKKNDFVSQFSGDDDSDSYENATKFNDHDPGVTNDSSIPESPLFKSKKTKRCRFVSENSSSDEETTKRKLSSTETNHITPVKTNISQLSSSEDENEPQQLNNESVSPKLNPTKKKFVIGISCRRIISPRSSVDVLQTPKKSEKRERKPKQKEESDADWSSEDDEDYISPEKKKKILHFFQESSAEELGTISECSLKKAEILVSLRPFVSWEDLTNKLNETKHLNEKLIWSCIDLLHERRTLCSLMEKCGIISEKLEKEFNEVRDINTESPRKSKSVTVAQQPDTIPENLILKPYQMIGLNWISLLHRNKVNGILADEMGLGKTIQTISFFAYLQSLGEISNPHLVVVPTSTFENWVREFNVWCPTLHVLHYTGSQVDRKCIRSDLQKGRLLCDVILTTYHLAVSTPEDRSLFRKLDICYAVFDEGHMLKNMSSQRYQQLMKIKAERRLLLTGTPLQNNLLELMSLLRFVMPHMFEETTNTLIRLFSQSGNETVNSNFYQRRIEHAKQIMQPFVLRRMKKDVLHQLPKKQETIVFCDMAPSQANLYSKVKTSLKNKTTKKNLPKAELRNVFMELRKVANHPLLRRELYTLTKLRKMARFLKNDVTYMDSDETYLYEDMEVMTDFELHNLCVEHRVVDKFKLTNNVLFDSGKFNNLDSILPRLHSEGKRVLIFSQFTMMMDILQRYLDDRKHKFLRLDGQTPMAERLNLIDTFNEDPSYFVFMLSTKAGGLGINLTSASVVILHDIDCNPYNDKQAEDRCHRVGQTKTVEIIKLVSKDSIEERMFQFAQNKLQLEKEMTENSTDGIDLAALITESLSS
uniref:DNA helicase n=1 Tax=Phallusia mammillata TaxID=59560 RepID=A0A6F9DTN9_9ASCI|nr:SWI/SNF-related matrix-associated actin-dependent regulator of chromatin subfamily A containing DEAD/H box 1 [Phallusia mammillata]